MKTKEIIVAFLLISALFTSCDKDDSDSDPLPATTSIYFPLEIGDRWEYPNRIRKVNSEVEVNNKKYMQVVDEFYEDDVLLYEKESFYRKNNQKVYKLYADKLNEFLFLDFSKREGESWKYKTANDDNEKWNVEVLSETNFTINKHIIENCKQFFYDVPNYFDEEHSITYAPGIGEISKHSSVWGFDETIKKAVINGNEFVFE